jgi:hypothetical protein
MIMNASKNKNGCAKVNVRDAATFMGSMALGGALLLTTGCASSRIENKLPSTQTQVNLNHANYKMVHAGAIGRSYGFRFLLGVIPLAAPSTGAARANLYERLGVPVDGKSVALINTVEDRSTTWLLLFSIPKLVVTGDVVEFRPEEVSAPQSLHVVSQQ